MKEKARKRPSTTAGRPRWSSSGPPALDDLVAAQVSTAMYALAQQDREAFEAAATRVAECPGVVGWARVAERLLTDYLQSAVCTAWRGGWQPADILRVASRRLGGRHVHLTRDAIAAELHGYAAATIDPRWTAQLTEHDVRVWWSTDQTYLHARCRDDALAWPTIVSVAIEVLSLLSALPELEKLGPIPGSARPGQSAARHQRSTVDERVLARVRALLAKAESTTFPAEAEAFSAGAQALMARHSIDFALLAASNHSSADEPTGRRIGIDNPYEAPKAALLAAVAEANRCRVVWSQQLGFSTVVGFPADLDAVDVLFTSLLIQATTAMTLAGSRTHANGRSRTRSFRQSFLTAYATRIGERLIETTGIQTAAAAAEPAGANLLPVLAARDDAVSEAVATMFPQLVQRAMSIPDREGWVSGRRAADLASLRTGVELPEAGADDAAMNL